MSESLSDDCKKDRSLTVIGIVAWIGAVISVSTIVPNSGRYRLRDWCRKSDRGQRGHGQNSKVLHVAVKCQKVSVLSLSKTNGWHGCDSGGNCSIKYFMHDSDTVQAKPPWCMYSVVGVASQCH